MHECILFFFFIINYFMKNKCRTMETLTNSLSLKVVDFPITILHFSSFIICSTIRSLVFIAKFLFVCRLSPAVAVPMIDPVLKAVLAMWSMHFEMDFCIPYMATSNVPILACNCRMTLNTSSMMRNALGLIILILVANKTFYREEVCNVSWCLHFRGFKSVLIYIVHQYVI